MHDEDHPRAKRLIGLRWGEKRICEANPHHFTNYRFCDILRCKQYGFDALIVKCADILDNIDYFAPTRGYEDLAQTLTVFLSISKDALEKEEIYRQLCDNVLYAEQLMAAFNQ